MSSPEPTYPAKKLIINLVKEAARPVSASALIRMAALFGVESNTVRVTLNRLSNSGFLSSTERGIYQLGEAAEGLARQQRRWRSLESTLRPWNGGWLVIYVAHLGRRDRKQLRRRERAAALLGFAAFNQGMLVRPDNLAMSVQSLSEQLQNLGLEPEASMFRACDFTEGAEPAPEQLWPLAELEAGYRRRIDRMRDWRKNIAGKTQEDAARESFLIGDEVLRFIAFDPRLPEEMLDTALRQEMIAEMSVFDDLGKKIWAEFMDSFGIQES